MARFEVSADESVLFESVLRSGLNAKQMDRRIQSRQTALPICSQLHDRAASCGIRPLRANQIHWRCRRMEIGPSHRLAANVHRSPCTLHGSLSGVDWSLSLLADRRGMSQAVVMGSGRAWARPGLRAECHRFAVDRYRSVSQPPRGLPPRGFDVPMAVVTAYILLALAVYLSSAWLLVMLS